MDNLEPASASNTQSGNPFVTTPESGSGQSHRVTIDQLLLAGAHFGHLTQRWNPKMKRYIFMARNGIYLIDLRKTQEAIERACREVSKYAAAGEVVMFVGTKKPARDIIEMEARRAGCPYITFRWLGGTLTNFATIRKSLKTLENYEKMITDGTYASINKKEQLSIEKLKSKLVRNLGGIRDMKKVPGAIFIVDTKREAIAVSEARRLGIPIFAIVDTNVDPDLIDFPIPANDDAFKSVGLITRAIADAVIEGGRRFDSDQEPEAEATAAAPDSRGRPRRARRRRRGGPRPGGAPTEAGSAAAPEGKESEE